MWTAWTLDRIKGDSSNRLDWTGLWVFLIDWTRLTKK
jgi:hypothetical protein